MASGSNPLTGSNQTARVSSPTCKKRRKREVEMTQAPAAIFKIATESPQPPRGKDSRARKAAAAQPMQANRAAGWVVGTETRAATRGDGEVIELDHGITVYPPRQAGGRWRAVWYENDERQQCESVSEESFRRSWARSESRSRSTRPTRGGHALT